MGDYLYENLPVAVREHDEYAEVGFVLHDGFFVFGGFKIAGFKEDVKEALEAQEAAKKAAEQS